MATPSDHTYTNRLINEKSPYLLQHAHNPVDWHAWGDEAFEKAREEKKPVFLSIGYSTCHWCHVMERESFEDEEVADLLNRSFVPIKVDREERPDIDKVYMSVCTAMTGSGGWPLTVIMTPEKKPFFAGTYFPKGAKWGRPGLTDILTQIAELWERDPGRIITASEQITGAVRDQRAGGAPAVFTRDTLQRGARELRGRFDGRHGGFGAAPKFPSPHNLSFLLRWWKRTGESDVLVMVEKTLDGMAQGGIDDHIGFGFARYSVDERWLVPHFEKMLYDQAMLAIAYTEAYQATRKERYRKIAEQIFSYVLRDMTSPAGAFYSAEDADSEGVEGKFYVWTPEEVKAVLGERDGDIFCRFYGITPGGNFEHGTSILHVEVPLEEFAKGEGMKPEALEKMLEEGRLNLFVEREKRVHPHKDDKVLTDWNGLMIAALAKGSLAFDDPRYARAAAGAADFMLAKMRTPDGRLLHRYRDGEAAVPGFLDDYAFMVWGLTELYEATFEARYLREALSLNREMLELFRDRDGGGLFFSAEGSEELISRSKEAHDGAYPSGTSVAALNLLRLGRLTADDALEREASGIMEAFSGSVGALPSGHTQFLIALDFALSPTREVVIAGDPEKEDTRAMLRAVRGRFMPDTVVLLHPGGEAGEEIEKVAPFVKGYEPLKGGATAYVCQNYSCALPATSLKELEERLDSKE